MVKDILLKSLLPTAKRYVENGLIDRELQKFKEQFKEHIRQEGDEVVIVNTTENTLDGERHEYLCICIMNDKKQLRMISLFSLSEVIDLLLKTK